MPKANGMRCYFCDGKVAEADHIAIDEEGEIVCMCDPCYQLAKKFFIKDVSSDEFRKRNLGGK